MNKNLIVEAIPSSFVARELKLLQDKGSGEAKLFIGSNKKLAEYDDFFGFNNDTLYKFDKENLLEYLLQVKIEYAYQSISKYKEVGIDTWTENFNKIDNLSLKEFECTLEKFVDSNRYYVKSKENIFKNIFRKLVLPKITNIVFEKEVQSNGKVIIKIKLEVNYLYKVSVDTERRDSNYISGYDSNFSRNRILFGAPGTGKSYTINNDRKMLLGEDNENDYERVTFHPDYSYAHFVGTYKPISCKDDDEKETITYEYVPGSFMRTLVKALKNIKTETIKPFLIIVEEINRANVAAVFGDVFQLLDRGNDDASEYSITTSREMRIYLAKEENLGGNPNDYEKIRIPNNMFIWATMNSADQGVYPMDTAFKRRWDFKYLGIDENDLAIREKVVTLGTGEYSCTIEWNALRKAINNNLSSYKINEDKLLGPYFLSKKIVVPSEGNEINANIFISAFKSKVLMYLFDDAAKQKRTSLFDGCIDTTKYSSICEEFDRRGVEIFCKEIRDNFRRDITKVAESLEGYE